VVADAPVLFVAVFFLFAVHDLKLAGFDSSGFFSPESPVTPPAPISSAALLAYIN